MEIRLFSQEKAYIMIDMRLFDYNSKSSKYDRLKALLTPNTCEGLTKVRVGGDVDGGYVFAQELLNGTDTIYSYGIGEKHQVSFDLQMANEGKKVYMYDGSIPEVPAQHPNFVFKKEHVYANTILDQIKTNGHLSRTNLTLKMDVEGEEWNIFEQCDDRLFAIFDEISLELHDVNTERYDEEGANYLAIKDDLERKANILEKINKYYFVFHIHGNNFSHSVDKMPNIPEVTFIRRDAVKSIPIRETRKYPIWGIDWPNWALRRELDISWWV